MTVFNEHTATGSIPGHLDSGVRRLRPPGFGCADLSTRKWTGVRTSGASTVVSPSTVARRPLTAAHQILQRKPIALGDRLTQGSST